MKSLQKIGYILIAFVYLFLSTGVALIKTNCLCSDSTDISFYDISDAEGEILCHSNCCEETLPVNETNKTHKNQSCECNNPIITYLKLTSHPNSNINLEYPIVNNIFDHSPNEIILTIEDVFTEEEIYPDYSPPEKPYGRTLISFLHQRKIALIA